MSCHIFIILDCIMLYSEIIRGPTRCSAPASARASRMSSVIFTSNDYIKNNSIINS